MESKVPSRKLLFCRIRPVNELALASSPTGVLLSMVGLLPRGEFLDLLGRMIGLQLTGTVLLVLEKVDGESLAERLERGALPLEESLRVCAQVAEGRCTPGNPASRADSSRARASISAIDIVSIRNTGTSARDGVSLHNASVASSTA